MSGCRLALMSARAVTGLPFADAMAKDDRQERLGGWPPCLQVVAATGALSGAVSRDGEADGHAA
eukprot:11286657-Alexandrium_andersonii.AAC.1